MIPARRIHIINLATNVYSARDQHRGRTVPAIREGGPWDGRAPGDEEYPPEKSLFERDMWRDKGC